MWRWPWTLYGDGKLATHPDDARTFSREVMSNLEQGVERVPSPTTEREAAG